MKQLKAIIVDDEESARDVLENLLHRFCEGIAVVSKSSEVPEAAEQIKALSPDVVFLDIEMPEYAGFELVNFVDEIDFETIFVTAYDQYAIRAFEVAAVDYLLKPVNIERLRASVERVRERRNKEEQVQRLQILSSTMEHKEIRNLVISDKNQQHVLSLDSIIALEAHESYTVIYTATSNYTASKNLKHFERILESNTHFFRVHKSWIVNRNHLITYSKSNLTVTLTGGITTKLSKYKKADFESMIQH